MVNFNYRAWDKKAQKMFAVSGVFLHQTNPDVICIRCFLSEHSGVGWLQKSDVGLMRFTGLLDKNGKEIFEGDVVTTELMPDANLEVTFSRGVYFFGGWVCTTVKSTDCKIVGNIYENPKLLTK